MISKFAHTRVGIYIVLQFINVHACCIYTYTNIVTHTYVYVDLCLLSALHALPYMNLTQCAVSALRLAGQAPPSRLMCIWDAHISSHTLHMQSFLQTSNTVLRLLCAMPPPSLSQFKLSGTPAKLVKAWDVAKPGQDSSAVLQACQLRALRHGRRASRHGGGVAGKQANPDWVLRQKKRRLSPFT